MGLYVSIITDVICVTKCIIISHTSTAIFNRTGGVMERHTRQPRPWFPEAVYDFMRAYIADHPCFFLEELQDALRMAFPDLANTSVPTICRALRHDLNLTRKRIQKRAREALPGEVADFKTQLKIFYCYPEQLVSIDETSKDGRSALRRYVWSTRGIPAIVELPFSRGKRVSALAASNSKGFLAWQFNTGNSRAILSMTRLSTRYYPISCRGHYQTQSLSLTMHEFTCTKSFRML